MPTVGFVDSRCLSSGRSHTCCGVLPKISKQVGWNLVPVLKTNPPPPAGTTADMILRHGADGQYEIYDIGNNPILAGYFLGKVGTDWRFAGLGGF